MRSGLLRHHGKFQIKTTAKDTYGEEDVTWTDDVEAYVAIFPISGKEYHFAQQTQSSVTHRIMLRYVILNNGDKINPNCRFVSDDGDVYEIISVIDKEMRHVELTLMVTEVL